MTIPCFLRSLSYRLRPISFRTGSGGNPCEKLPHGESDLLDMRFKCKVSRIEQLDTRVRVVALEGLRSGRDKERIMLAPNGEQRRLGVAEIFLKDWIEGEVRSVIEKEIELDVFIAGALQQSSVQSIGFRRDHLRISNAMRVLPACALVGQQGVPDNLAVLGGWLRPIAPNRIPCIAETFLIRVRILRDDCRDSLRGGKRT